MDGDITRFIKSTPDQYSSDGGIHVSDLDTSMNRFSPIEFVCEPVNRQTGWTI